MAIPTDNGTLGTLTKTLLQASYRDYFAAAKTAIDATSYSNKATLVGLLEDAYTAHKAVYDFIDTTLA